MTFYDKYIKYKNKYLQLKTGDNIGSQYKEYKEYKEYKLDKNIKNNNIVNIIGFVNKKDIPCIEYLNLQLRGIIGQIPPNVFDNFINMTKLNLSNNKIEANFPKLDLPNLIYLNLSNNKFIGNLSNICCLKNLTHLDISNNYINGRLGEISNFVMLKYLNISDNNFNENISNHLDKLLNLEYLNLSSNKISGNFPIYFTKFSKLQYLNISNTLITGSIPKQIYCLDKLEQFDFSIENFDYDLNNSCAHTINNYVGSCWNLSIMMIFLMGDKTNKTIIDWFTKYKNYDQYKNYIDQINLKFDIKKIYEKYYFDPIQELKKNKDNQLYLKNYSVEELKDENLMEQKRREYKSKNPTNKLVFLFTSDTIAKFIELLSNRLKFLNISIPANKKLIIEDISKNIDESTQNLYHEMFPLVGREKINGGRINEQFNFTLLIAIIFFSKKINFINYSYDIDNYNLIFKHETLFYNRITIDTKYIDNCIGIEIKTEKHSMAFYKCNDQKFFCNCYEENKIIPFDYEIMFENIKFLNTTNTKFQIQCDPTDFIFPFIFEIFDNKHHFLMCANKTIKNFNNLDNITQFKYKEGKIFIKYDNIVGFIFIILEDIK